MNTAKTLSTMPLLVIVLAAFALYANTLSHDFALDDAIVIIGNDYTQKGIKGIPEILTNEGFAGFFGADYGMVAGGRYRPMAQVFFAIEYELFGLNPFVGHLMNVLYYALLCALVFVVLRRLFDNTNVETGRVPSLQPAPSPYLTLPFIATMVFLVHPLHTEVVANIKGRDEIFAMLGAMGALYFSLNYVTYHRRDGARPASTGHRITTLVGVFLAFLFGLLSKENTLTFLVVIPLTMYMFLKRRFLSGVEGRPYKRIMAMLLAATVVYVVMRYNASGYWTDNPGLSDILLDPFVESTGMQRLATVLFTWLVYFKLLFIPYPLTHDYYPYHIPVLDFGDARVWLAVAMVALLVWAVIKNFRKNPVPAYGLLFFVITFSMASNVFFNIGTFMNERFMFMPLLGFAIIVGYGVQRWAATPSLQGVKKWVLPIVLIAVGLTLSGLTIQRNRAWKDNLTLLTTDVKVSSRSMKANFGAGEMLVRHATSNLPVGPARHRTLEQARGYLLRAVELYPLYNTAWGWLGQACLYLEYYEEAFDAIHRALHVGGRSWNTMAPVHIAQFLEKKGEKEWAKQYYRLALEVLEGELDRLAILVNYHLLDQNYAAADVYVDHFLQRMPHDAWALSVKADIQKHQ